MESGTGSDTRKRSHSRERERLPTSGIQKKIGRGRSPIPGKVPQRPLPTKNVETTTDSSTLVSEAVFSTSQTESTQQTEITAGSSKEEQESQEILQNLPSHLPSEKWKEADDEDDDDHDFVHCDDNSQYNEFLWALDDRRLVLGSQGSFPVSERSEECAAFNKCLNDLVTCLQRSKTHWLSVDCLGRIWVSKGGQRKIRTTVVVSFSRYPDQSEVLRQDLQRVMTSPVLPIEFVEGRVAKYCSNPFGFFDPQTPLVCGSSCSPHGMLGAGTIGGFITVDGDPDPEAVYAVTNHHVIAVDGDDTDTIPWTMERNMEIHLGLSEQQSEDLAELQRNVYDRTGIKRILECLGSLNPKPERNYGENRESYVRDFVRQFIHSWNQLHPMNRINRNQQHNILESVDETLSQFNIPAQRINRRQEYHRFITMHGLRDFENDIMEDMRSFLGLHYYELQIPLQLINNQPWNGELRGISLFKDLIRIRRLWRHPPDLSKIIEHPAKVDMYTLVRRSKKNRKSALSCSTTTGSSGERYPGPGPVPAPQEVQRHEIDANSINDKIHKLTLHAASANRLIGTVWASSGISHKREDGWQWPLAEDWALIKLFRGEGQQFSNTFSHNLLRPEWPEDSFRAVKSMFRPISFDVSKRGRTTDYTVGKINGSISVTKSDGVLNCEFGIVSVMKNGYFSMAGDSGSWIMDRAGQLIGMLGSGRTRFLSKSDNKEVDDLTDYEPDMLEVEDITYFTPARYLFNWMEKSFEEAMRRPGNVLEPNQGLEGRIKLCAL